MPGARRRALRSRGARGARRSRAVPAARHRRGDGGAAAARFAGVGEWTAHYIALRAAREPDAFPASDVGPAARRQPRGGATARARGSCSRRAERWRPWRAYAAQHLWAADAAPDSSKEDPMR